MRTKNYPGARIKAEPIPSNGKEGNVIAPLVLHGNPEDDDRWRLGACPRCKGDVFLDSEDGQLLGHCLQCGYVGARILTPPLVTGKT
jgi:hypothetical protein